jgi:hypothetical protein
MWMATAVPLGILTFGLLIVGLGIASWRTGGKGAVWGGALLVILSIYLLLKNADSPAQYAALAVDAVVLLLVFMKDGRAAWRRLSVEVLLAGAAVLAIGCSLFISDARHDLRTMVAILVGGLTAAFIVSVLIRFGELLRTPSKPRG